MEWHEGWINDDRFFCFFNMQKREPLRGLREVFETDGRRGHECCSRSLFQDTYHIHFINTDSAELFPFPNNPCTDYSWASMTGTKRSVTAQTYRPLTDSMLQSQSAASMSERLYWKVCYPVSFFLFLKWRTHKKLGNFSLICTLTAFP